MNRPTCETCPFWKPIEADPGAGRCQYNAPAPTNDIALDSALAFWPITGSKDFCGCHPQFADFKFQWRQAEIRAIDEVQKVRCQETWLNARCMLTNGHSGSHEYHHRDLDQYPGRCQIFMKGERCGKQTGHEGKHVWERGD